MRIIEVIDKPSEQQFLNVVDKIYADDRNYVRPLDFIINEIFDPNVNPFYKHGSAVRYVLIDPNNNTIGRIAAFINEKKAYGFEQPTGGVGFFECLNNQEAANLLFQKAKEWLQSKGMEAMDGPINFGENDNFWGLLVDGFSQASFGMQYNPPYYQSLFENFGFTTYFEQITNSLDIKKPFPERFWKIAEWVVRKDGYHFKHFSLKNQKRFIADFESIYNDAWQFHENFVPINRQFLIETIKKVKPFVNENLIWFAYHNHTPIGFLVLFPDINQIFKHFNGKLNWYNKLRFLWMKKRNYITRARVVILGIIPKFQRSGIESGLFLQLKGAVEKMPHINELELSWVGDFNPKMRTLQDSMGADFSKKHITYRYLFNNQKLQQERATTIPRNTKEQSKVFENAEKK